MIIADKLTLVAMANEHPQWVVSLHDTHWHITCACVSPSMPMIFGMDGGAVEAGPLLHPSKAFRFGDCSYCAGHLSAPPLRRG